MFQYNFGKSVRTKLECLRTVGKVCTCFSVTGKCPLQSELSQLSLRKVPAARAESDNQPLAQAAPAHSTPRSTAPWLAWTPHDKPAALLSLTCV